MNLEAVHDDLFLARRDRQVLYVFWFGFLLYTGSYTLSTTETFNYNLCQFFQIIGIFIFVPAAVHLIGVRISSKYLQILFVLYIFWLLIVVIRGISFDYNAIKFILFDAWYGGFLYVVPLFLLFPLKLNFYKNLFDVVIISGIVYIAFDMLFIRELMRPGQNLQSQAIIEYFSKTLAVPSLFLLLTYRYHNFQKNLFAIIILLVTVFFAIVRARRGLIVMEVLPLALMYLLYLSNTSGKLFIILLSIFLCGFIAIFGMEIFNPGQGGMFANLMDRGLEDTRSSVETCFFQDFGFNDWMVGRGMLGEYFCPGIDPNDITGYRSTIETDYLQIILKGGILSLALFLLVIIPAVIKGLFFSKNLLSKGAAMWILWSLVIMYPSTIHTFTLQYILVWIAVGICYSKIIRSIPDEILVDYFQGNKNAAEVSKAIQDQTLK